MHYDNLRCDNIVVDYIACLQVFAMHVYAITSSLYSR